MKLINYQEDLLPPALWRGDDELFFNEAEAWLAARNPFKAERILDKVQECLWREPDLLLLRFGIYRASKKWELAWEVALDLAEVIPSDVRSWTSRAESERRRPGGNPLEAWRALQPALKRFENDDLLYLAARYASEAGVWEMAEELLFRALFRNPALKRDALRRRCFERFRNRISMDS